MIIFSAYNCALNVKKYMRAKCVMWSHDCIYKVQNTERFKVHFYYLRIRIFLNMWHSPFQSFFRLHSEVEYIFNCTETFKIMDFNQIWVWFQNFAVVPSNWGYLLLGVIGVWILYKFIRNPRRFLCILRTIPRDFGYDT